MAMCVCVCVYVYLKTQKIKKKFRRHGVNWIFFFVLSEFFL